MKDSEKIRVIAEKLLREFGELYRCDDMSDYYAPPELGLKFNHLGFLIEDNHKYITIKYRGYEVYNESTNHLSSNDINPIGWMDLLANLYYDMPKTRRLIEKEVDFQKSADTFSFDYLRKIRRSCWVSDRVQFINTLSPGPGYKWYDNYRVYYDKKLVMHYRENGEVFTYIHGDWEKEIERFCENGCRTSEQLENRKKLDEKLNHFWHYTVLAIKEDTWVSEHTEIKRYITNEEPGEDFVINYEAYTDGELMFYYKSVSDYTGRCLIYKPGRWEDDVKYYVQAFRAGTVPESIREKNAREKELKRIKNGNKSYY